MQCRASPADDLLLGGPWVVISGVTSRVTILITHVRGLITLLVTTHEPPSRVCRTACVSSTLAYMPLRTECNKVLRMNGK